jgi:acyl carrier protein
MKKARNATFAQIASTGGEMDKKEIIKLFSEFWEIDEAKVTTSLKLNDPSLKDQNSIRFFEFIAAVESNFNVRVKNLSRIATVGDLLDNITY